MTICHSSNPIVIERPSMPPTSRQPETTIGCSGVLTAMSYTPTTGGDEVYFWYRDLFGRVVWSGDINYIFPHRVYDGLNKVIRQPVEWDFGTETYVKLPGRTVNVWGRDLSGTLGGAGGTGGLLAVQRGGVWHFPLYDGGGNITAYIDESGNVAATYAYGPYGETVSHTGQDFDYRFSTKPYNEVLNTYRFACREYAPDLHALHVLHG